MRVIESPQALPGQCRFCGHAQRGPYMDTEISEEFYGAWIICKECFAGMAHMMGYLPLEQMSRTIDRLSDFELEVTDLQIRLDAALRAITDIQVAATGYQNVLRIEDGSSISTVNKLSDSKSGSLAPGSEMDTESEPEGAKQLVSRKGKTSKSVHDEGVEQLHSTTDESGSFKFNL